MPVLGQQRDRSIGFYMLPDERIAAIRTRFRAEGEDCAYQGLNSPLNVGTDGMIAHRGTPGHTSMARASCIEVVDNPLMRRRTGGSYYIRAPHSHTALHNLHVVPNFVSVVYAHTGAQQDVEILFGRS